MVQKLDTYEESMTAEKIREMVDLEFGIDLHRVSDEGEGKLISSYTDEIMQGIRSTMKCHPSEETDEVIMSLSKVEAMDLYIDSCGGEVEIEEAQPVIDRIFGINLEGISNLKEFRISLYSKGQWLAKQKDDLFLISTGKGDVEVEVYPTPYFRKQTGVERIPDKLGAILTGLGFVYQQVDGTYYFTNPTGETVEDAFKDKTIVAIANVVASTYEQL